MTTSGGTIPQQHVAPLANFHINSEGILTMYDTINQHGSGRLSDYSSSAEIDVSKLSAMIGRVHQATMMADDARAHLGANLDRLLGAVPTAVSNSKSGADPRVSTGAIGELDEAISCLIISLEYLGTQAQRLGGI